MNFLSDILVATGAFGAAIFCLVLSRRLRRLTAMDSGMGKAIAVLSAQVDDLARALKTAQQTARASAEKLDTQTRRAEAACRQLELLMASLHDLPQSAAPPENAASTAGVSPHARPPSSWNGAPARRASSTMGAAEEAAEPAARGPRLLRRRTAFSGA